MTFRYFFLRGLGIVLPTILTIWILVAVYQFVEQNIANPINAGIRQLVLVSGWPAATEDDYLWISERLAAGQTEAFEDKAREWGRQREAFGERFADLARSDPPEFSKQLRAARVLYVRQNMTWEARSYRLDKLWNGYTIGNWVVLDVTGLLVAIFIIYVIGRLLGGFIGRGMIKQGERLLLRVPIFKQIYPYVKQVTDFFVGDKEDKLAFSNVVAVEYPRKGLWSIGLVTGNTMQFVQDAAGTECLTVFVPSSPTPFTGYVITVPKRETIDMPISIDDALRFAVSGGVIVPPNQQIAVQGAQPALPEDEVGGRGESSDDASQTPSSHTKEVSP